MKKKSVLSVLALSCVLCLCSCSGSSENKTESSDNTPIYISSVSDTDTGVWEYRVSSSDYSITTISNKDVPVITTNSSLKGKDLVANILMQENTTDSVSICINVTEEHNIESVFDYHSDTCNFKVKMTDTNGILNELEGRVFSNSSMVIINKTDYVRKIIDALHQNGKISFELIDNEFPASTYSFSVDTSNFDEVYRKSGYRVQSNLLHG